MKKAITLFLILSLTAAICFSLSACNNAIEDYVLGADTIASISAIVGERTVVDTLTFAQDNLTTMTTTYLSDSVRDDLIAYTQHLRNDGGFVLTMDMDLDLSPSKAEFGKPSVDPGHIIVMAIDYDSAGYTITIQKGVGEFYIE